MARKGSTSFADELQQCQLHTIVFLPSLKERDRLRSSAESPSHLPMASLGSLCSPACMQEHWLHSSVLDCMLGTGRA